MVINMRYYVITIASIFIALGIGIFIGFNINSDDLYMSQQQIIMDALEVKFSELNVEKEYFSKEIDKLMVENKKNINVIDQFYYEIIKYKLQGLNIGIIITGMDYSYDDIRGTLENAGAKVPIEFQFNSRAFDITQEDIRELNERFRLQVMEKEDFLTTINEEIVYLLTFGRKSGLMDFFINKNYISFRGDMAALEENPIHYVVIAGGGLYENEKVETLDVDIIRKCLKNLIPVVGVEREDVGYSHIPHYQRMNISTVDNINTPMGRISLIYVLGGEEGHYGEKEYSEQLIPFNSED